MEIEKQPVENDTEIREKHNTGAKIAVALGLGGVVGGKLSIPGLVMDVNNLFPKGTSLGSKFKQAFSKNVFPLMEEAVKRQTEKGRGPLMAILAASKWSMILPAVGGIILGVIGWKRADRIQDSKDIYKHPIKSTKIIFGFQEPDLIASKQPKEIRGKHTLAVVAERDAQTNEIQIQR